MDYLVTFFEGVITFVSPCLLPMLPLYLAYFAGGSREGGVRHTLFCALGFVLGFSAVFVVLGAFAGSVGSLLVRYQRMLDVVCGVIVIVMGLGYLGVIKLPLLQAANMGTARPPVDFASALVFGMVFAVGWSPCVGTFLASALSLAASSGYALHGVALLLCFSLGLGLPFVLSAVLMDQLKGAFDWIKQHYEIINRLSGVMLIVIGLLMATGLFGTWLRLLS